MDGMSERFVNECRNSNTTVAVFIKLFNMWEKLDSEQRGQIIDSEIQKRRIICRKIKESEE